MFDCVNINIPKNIKATQAFNSTQTAAVKNARAVDQDISKTLSKKLFLSNETKKLTN